MLVFSEPRVVCRPALPSDTSDVVSFTRQIWEGRDYIHLVWGDWLADPTGILISAQYGGRVVGIAKVTPVYPGQWWLHGLRVDPEFQGRKIGSHLHEYADAWWLRYGSGVIRLLTSTQRVQVHRLCARTGYERVGKIAQYRYVIDSTAATRPSAFELVAQADLAEALAFAVRHNPHNAGLMDTGWRCVRPAEAVFSDLQRDGHLHWWRDRAGLIATWVGDDDDYAVLGIGFAAVEAPELLADLLRDAVKLTAGHKVMAMFWLAPAVPSVESALLSAGYQSDDDHGYLFEKRHPGR